MSDSTKSPQTSAEYIAYFRRRAAVVAKLPPVSPPPPRSVRQVAKILDAMYANQNLPSLRRAGGEGKQGEAGEEEGEFERLRAVATEEAAKARARAGRAPESGRPRDCPKGARCVDTA